MTESAKPKTSFLIRVKDGHTTSLGTIKRRLGSGYVVICGDPAPGADAAAIARPNAFHANVKPGKAGSMSDARKRLGSGYIVASS